MDLWEENVTSSGGKKEMLIEHPVHDGLKCNVTAYVTKLNRLIFTKIAPIIAIGVSCML